MSNLLYNIDKKYSHSVLLGLKFDVAIHTYPTIGGSTNDGTRADICIQDFSDTHSFAYLGVCVLSPCKKAKSFNISPIGLLPCMRLELF